MIDEIVCRACNGAGTIRVMNGGFFALFSLFSVRRCPNCNGRGYKIVAAKEDK